MSESFVIKPKPLKPNHLFMDIHKIKKDNETKEFMTPFEEIRDYQSRISLLFKDIPAEHNFWLLNGVPLKNLRELYDAINTMSDETFFHHVQKNKNDFSKWVENVYHDEELAFKLHKAKTREETKKAIEERIDSIIDINTEESKDKNFFKALISKLSKQNEKLEKQLIEKKNWLLTKEKELERWNLKNLEYEKKLARKFLSIEQKESMLMKKLQSLNRYEKELNDSVIKQKKDIELKNKILEEKEKSMEKKFLEKEKNIEEEHKELEVKRKKHELISKSTLIKRNQHIYTRLDELMSYATVCIHNKNYKEAKDAMSKVRYYYSTLRQDDPMKREYYQKIIRLKKHIGDILGL